MIKITSKRHNFRRCGVAHPKGPVEYPDDRFSQKELKVLEGEPMLSVEVVEATSDVLVDAAKLAIEAGQVTANGKPEVKAIETILGVSITAVDRDKAWETLQGKPEE